MLNRCRLPMVGLLLGLVIAACAEGGDGAPSAPAPAPTNAAPTAPASIEQLLATADPDKGKVLFLQCRACHSLEAGGPNKVGPNLHDFFGRKAGQAPGFNYSDAVAQSAVVWSAATLDQWLARPSEFLPGNRMVFVGVRKPEDRANLIAYLRRETTPAKPR